MTNIPKFYRLLFVIACTFCFNVAVQAEPANLGILQKTVEAYHDSGAYDRELSAIIQKAKHFINQKAEINAHLKHPQKLAIVLDIDETSLSNYSHMLPRQFVATKEQFIEEIQAADATAIKPTLALYRDALRHHIAVFFVTGRPLSVKTPTEKNLKQAGFTTWTGLYFKPNSYSKHSIIPYKSHMRANITHQGYTILASIGDQYSDIKGGYAEAGFKLPNPFYFLP